MSFGLILWVNTQNQQQESGTSQALLLVFCVWFMVWCVIGATCFVFLWWLMVWLGIAIFLSKEMSLHRLIIRFGHFYAIWRCVVWFSLGRWIKKSKGLVRNQCRKLIDLRSLYQCVFVRSCNNQYWNDIYETFQCCIISVIYLFWWNPFIYISSGVLSKVHMHKMCLLNFVPIYHSNKSSICS